LVETQKKVVGKGVAISLSVLVVILAVSNVLIFTSLQNRVTALNNENIVLQNQINSVNTTYRNYASTHTYLNSEYNILNNEKTQLQIWLEGNLSRVNLLNTQLRNLQNSYQILQSTYQNLLQQPAPIGTALETYYDYVRANSITFGLEPIGEERWTDYPNYYDNSVSFAAVLAAHDVGNAYWPIMETGSDYYAFTGEYSYQTSSRIMEQAFTLAGISYSDSSTTKIDKILGFINSIIHYESRCLDHMWFPCETLTFHSGDCTSFSILAGAMLEEAGIKSAIGFFTNSTKSEGHAMVLVHLDNLGQHGYYYFNDLTSYGLTSGKWIIIEPQCSSLTIQDKYLDWIASWSIAAASEVPYGS
jgi:hypothetical protein